MTHRLNCCQQQARFAIDRECCVSSSSALGICAKDCLETTWIRRPMQQKLRNVLPWLAGILANIAIVWYVRPQEFAATIAAVGV